MTYQEKLKDPRWQKKRLRILDRDQWACQRCGDKENTLHVHHKYYESNAIGPWDYPDVAYITLCDSCHENEHHWERHAEAQLLKSIKKNFLVEEIRLLKTAFRGMKLLAPANVVASAYSWALLNEEIQQDLIDKYYQRLSEPVEMKKMTKVKRDNGKNPN